MQRNPVPEDPVQGFSMMVYLLAHQLGIDKTPEIFNYVEMLTEACSRYVFEQHNQIPPQRKADKERKTFIVVFKARYLQLTDFEYDRPITGVDGKLIKQVTTVLESKSFTTDEFLGWVFDIFLDENPKFCPPSIKSVCSSFVMDKFLYEHRDKIKERHENSLHQKEGIALINRARVLMREAKEAANEPEREKIKKIMLDYRDRNIMLGEFRKKIEDLERKSRE